MGGGDPTTAAVARPIRVDERSGVLHPRNIEHYRATWFDPAPEVAAVVDQYWHVEWRLEPGEVLRQRIIDLPAITLTIEEGDVPAPFVVTGVQSRAWRRDISGAGSVFAVRLRPAGAAVLGDLAPRDVADAAVPLTSAVDAQLHSLLTGVASSRSTESRVRAADAAIAARLTARPPEQLELLANAVLDELRARVRTRVGVPLARHFGVSERTIQRALSVTIGRGPKWISRRIRLQEVARLLSTDPALDLAGLAADLGYADQAHLINDFRGVAGVTPGSYARSVARFAE
jgi:AraC-like DNA-binding protein